MDLEQYITIGLTSVGLAGGFVAYIIALIVGIDRKLSKLEALVSAERILAIVNGKYVRMDLYEFAHKVLEDKLESLELRIAGE
jgi:hypothetical protein